MKIIITKSQFIKAYFQYCDEEGNSTSSGEAAFVWRGFVENKVRQESGGRFNGQTEQQIWLDVLKPYLKFEEEKVEVDI